MPRFGSDPRDVVLALIASGMLDDVENDSIIVVTMGKSDSLPCIHGVKEFADAVDALAEKQSVGFRLTKVSEDANAANNQLSTITGGKPVKEFIEASRESKCSNCIARLEEAAELLATVESMLAAKK